ncbi:hypothetical protein DUNSADRAFT_9298 [Dunaliella salina]|uniref:ADP,ATP carrier protein n=1 Tax=Dunaliella salina TaxID=3046 RepID=A0ABQ7GHQ0_DUNSA|nr:hypothetical protein DUNSADRAFT_9298 [Dunaliella salina]|eukprot:KAF5834138.1 hypothetical protein DUNSADRAFT_9298 [Dunaliella salina]
MQVLLKRFYTFLALILLAFYALYHTSLLHGRAVSSILDTRELAAAGSEQAQDFVRHKGDASMDAFQRMVRCAFYVWLNVQNLVVLSCMWARCADVFSSEAASRLFGLISAGATAGQLVGSLTAMAVTRTAPLLSLPMCMVIPVAAGLMYMAALLSIMVRGGSNSNGSIVGGGGSIGSNDWGGGQVGFHIAGEHAFAHAPFGEGKPIGGVHDMPRPRQVHLRGGRHGGRRSEGAVGVRDNNSQWALEAHVHVPGEGGGGEGGKMGEELWGNAHMLGRSGGVGGVDKMLQGKLAREGVGGELKEAPGSLCTNYSSSSGGSKAVSNGFMASPGGYGSSISTMGPITGLVDSWSAKQSRLWVWLQEHLGGVLEGFTLIAASSYLMLLCGYLLMTYIVGSLMYFQRSLVVATMVKAANDRTQFFATVYSFSAVVICALQLLATGILGVGIQPSTTTVAMAEILRKVVGYSMVRPAREVLYTVVTREEKYKAKLSIDSVVQRLGDTVAAAVFEVLDVQMHLGLSGVAMAGAALCLVWIVWAVRLGRRHALLSSHSSARLVKA